MCFKHNGTSNTCTQHVRHIRKIILLQKHKSWVQLCSLQTPNKTAMKVPNANELEHQESLPIKISSKEEVNELKTITNFSISHRAPYTQPNEETNTKAQTMKFQKIRQIVFICHNSRQTRSKQ